MQAKTGKKSARALRISVIVAGALVIALMLAGTLLRMHTREMDFGAALASFMSDTFHPGSYAPEKAG